MGEATKFSKKPFGEMLESLFKIKTGYLVVVDILSDPDIDYRLLMQSFAKKGQVGKTVFEGKHIGFLLKVDN